MKSRRGARLWIPFLLCLATGPICAKTERERAAPPTCALLADKAFDLHKSSLFSLLELKLSKNSRIRLLERVELERIVEEKRLQMLLSSEGGMERVAFGRLLQAEILVLLRAREEKNRHLDVVVCETKKGLRLSVGKAALSDNSQEDAEAICDLIQSALDKYGEGVEIVCAVPPFVSNDFLHQYDYLQTTYAKLIEQALLKQKGILVVELDEARSIAEELALQDKGTVERNLPFYFMGEFRNEEKDGDPKVSIRLALKQGEKELTSIRKDGLSSLTVGPLLMNSMNEILKEGLARKTPIWDPDVEARLLAKRANALECIGSWSEALDLIEAALLLNPDQMELHYDAVRCISRIVSRSTDSYFAFENFKSPEKEEAVQKTARELNYARLACRHAEIVLRNADIPFGNSPYSDWFRVFLSIPHPTARAQSFPEVKLLYANYLRERREMLLSLMEAKADAGKLTIGLLFLLNQSALCLPEDVEEPAEEKYCIILRAISCLHKANIPDGWKRNLAYDYVQFHFHRETLLPDHAEFVEKIAEIPDKNIQAVVKDLRGEYEVRLERTRRGKYYQERPWSSRTPYSSRKDFAPPLNQRKPDILFSPLRDIRPDSQGSFELSGWMPCGKNMDVLWGDGGIYLMKKRGTLQYICHYSKDDFLRIDDYVSERSCRIILRPDCVCYDGRLIWAPVSKKREPIVLAIDPKSERVFQFTEKDGLPPMTHGAQCTEVSPGRACVAGCFGKDSSTPTRSWCALLELSGKGKKSVIVFHEARILREALKDRELGKDVVFDPKDMWTLVNPENRDEKVIFLKAEHPVHSKECLLRILPDGGSVEVWHDPIGSAPYPWVDRDEGALYWCTFANYGTPDAGASAKIWRCSFPDFKPALVASGLEHYALTGDVIRYQGNIHVLGQDWWMAKPGGQIKKLYGDIPDKAGYGRAGNDIRRLFLSSRYGLLYRSRTYFYQVELSPNISFENEMHEKDSLLPAQDALSCGREEIKIPADHLMGGRLGDTKTDRLFQGGGGLATEQAVFNALQWLKRHQNADGSWGGRGFSRNCDPRFGEPCNEFGGVKFFEPGLTGLALMAFLGAGYGEGNGGAFLDTVEKGLAYLLKIQTGLAFSTLGKGNGYLVESLQNHAYCTIAMAEAYALTGKIEYKNAAQKGVAFIASRQNDHPEWQGEKYGWDCESYYEIGKNNTFDTGWMVLALKSAEAVGLKASPKCFDGAINWLDFVTDGEEYYVGYNESSRWTNRGCGGYSERFLANETSTAIAVLCRLLFGEKITKPVIQRGASLLNSDLPEWNEKKGTIDFHYWFWGTYAMFQVGGESWRIWNQRMKEALLSHQCKISDGCRSGSWDPEASNFGIYGRTYATALNCLTLEVYYRYRRMNER